MEWSISWETNSHPASQEIPHLLQNPKVYIRVHKGLAILRPSMTFCKKLFFFRRKELLLKFCGR